MGAEDQTKVREDLKHLVRGWSGEEGGGWHQVFGAVLDALKRLVGRSTGGERRGFSLTPGAGIRFLIVYPPLDSTLLTCLVRIRCDGEQAFVLHEPCALVPAPT
jgi:hypothetical protein